MASEILIHAGVVELIVGVVISSIAASAAAYFFAPRPKVAGNEREGRTTNVRSAETPQHVVYGFATKGGTLFYINGVGEENEFLHQMIALAGHECHDIGRVYFNAEQVENFAVDYPLPPEGRGDYLPQYLASLRASVIRDRGAELDDNSGVRFRLGATDQDAHPFAVERNDNWTEDHRVRGTCYSYVILRYDPVIFSSFIPVITNEVFGKNDILDPRDGERRWTMNPALIIADLMETYLGVARSNIDEATLIESANFCDEELTRKDGSSEPRYTANGFFELDGDWEEWLTPFITAMAGSVVEWGGTYFIHAGAWRDPVLTITDDDFMGPFSRKVSESDRERSNSAKGTFVGPQTFDQPTEFPTVKDAVAIGEDGGRVNWLELDLEMVNTHTQAQRVANILLQESRLDETITIEVPLVIGLDLKPWDNVDLQSNIFAIDETYRVIGHRLTPGIPISIELTLKRHDEEVYDWNPATQERDLQSSRSNIPGVGISNIPTSATFSISPLFEHPDHRVAGVEFRWDDPEEPFEAIEMEITGRAECRTSAQPADASTTPPTDAIPPGAWEIVSIPEVREVAPGVETLEFEIEDESKSNGPYDFRNHAVEKVRIRARLSAGSYGPWIVPSVG